MADTKNNKATTALTLADRTMIPRIKNFSTTQDFHLLVIFDDGKMVRYDVGEDIKTIPAFHALKEEHALFQNAQLDQSRTCIYWTDRIDLASDTIYEYGETVNAKRYAPIEDNYILHVAEVPIDYRSKH